MDNEFGARIRALRKERGLSQEALAQALEVSRQAVTKWEDGSSLHLYRKKNAARAQRF